MPDLPFTLVPADDEVRTPGEERAAAVAGALAEPDAIVPVADEPPVPLGRSWLFDWQAGRFIYQGGSPAPANGFGAVAQWVLMAINSARYAHAVFSDAFGMEDPSSPIGQLATREIVATYEQHVREAVLVHERITALERFSATLDPVAGELHIDYFEITTDEEEVISFEDITLSTRGQGAE